MNGNLPMGGFTIDPLVARLFAAASIIFVVYILCQLGVFILTVGIGVCTHSMLTSFFISALGIGVIGLAFAPIYFVLDEYVYLQIGPDVVLSGGRLNHPPDGQ